MTDSERHHNSTTAANVRVTQSTSRLTNNLNPHTYRLHMLSQKFLNSLSTAAGSVHCLTLFSKMY